MAFIDQLKTFTNRGPYERGESFVTHRGRKINTTLGSQEYDDFVEALMQTEYITWTVTPGYDHRPDAIADKFLGASELFWIILVFNNITDPFENLELGSKVKIPQI